MCVHTTTQSHLEEYEVAYRCLLHCLPQVPLGVDAHLVVAGTLQTNRHTAAPRVMLDMLKSVKVCLKK